MSHAEDLRVVLFDALGTLIELTSPVDVFQRVMADMGYDLTREQIRSAIRRAHQWWMSPTRVPGSTFQEEKADRQKYAAMFLEDLGIDHDGSLVDEVAERGNWARWVSVYPDVIPTLEALGRDYLLAVVTNGGPSMCEAINYAGLGRYFQEVFASWSVGYQKPDPRAYNVPLAKLGYKPSQACFIDDTPENVAGALDCGIRAVLLDRKGEHQGWTGERVSSLVEFASLLAKREV